VQDLCGSHDRESEDRYDAVLHYYQRFKEICFLQILGKAGTANTSYSVLLYQHGVTSQETQFSIKILCAELTLFQMEES
jgi:hypothetical protein